MMSTWLLSLIFLSTACTKKVQESNGIISPLREQSSFDLKSLSKIEGIEFEKLHILLEEAFKKDNKESFRKFLAQVIYSYEADGFTSFYYRYEIDLALDNLKRNLKSQDLSKLSDLKLDDIEFLVKEDLKNSDSFFKEAENTFNEKSQNLELFVGSSRSFLFPKIKKGQRSIAKGFWIKNPTDKDFKKCTWSLDGAMDVFFIDDVSALQECKDTLGAGKYCVIPISAESQDPGAFNSELKVSCDGEGNVLLFQLRADFGL